MKPNNYYIDGSSAGLYGYYETQTGKAVIIEDDMELTNNQAEWLALYALVLDLPDDWEGTVYSDSELVVNQFNGEYAIRDPELRRIAKLVRTVCESKHLRLRLVWIPREENEAGKEIERRLARRRVARWLAEQEGLCVDEIPST
jgi:ribonuclease HI